MALGLAAGAAAAGELRADAGASEQALGLDTTLPVEGHVFGGEAPYQFAWSIDGDTDRFEGPQNRTTSVNVSGLSGTVTLTFAVEDATGATASDEVLYHVAEHLAEPVDETLLLGAGLPDELVGASGLADQQTRDVAFSVPAEADRVVARLSWENPSINDLDLVLLDPDGEEATGNQGRSAGHPELVRHADPIEGEWTARIEPWLSTPEQAHLEVYVLDTVELPSAKIVGPSLFGVEDTVVANGSSSPAEATASWDTDADGLFDDGTGDGVEIGVREPGEHLVRYQVTDAQGFRDLVNVSLEVTDAAEHALSFRCRDKPHWGLHSMEYSWSLGTCWMHGGHHTYTLEDTVEIVGGQGRLFSVEQQFSPPTEYEEAPFKTPLALEVSTDGVSWERLDAAEYRFLEDPREGSIGFLTRQAVHFSFETEPTPAEMFRVHQPRSAAQGLSGFIDASRGYLLANDTDAGPPQAPPEGSLELSCQEDLMEAFFAEHPCWYGGINRYDAASFFHTYHPGEGTMVDRVEASVAVGPWRTDDWFRPITFQVEEQVNQTTQTRVHLQASPDGQAWSTIATHVVPFGQETTFATELAEPAPASFLRLVTDHHPLSEEYRSSAPLHHPEAYFLHSELAIDVTSP